MHLRTRIDSEFALASSDIRPTTNQFIPSRKGARRKQTDMNQASFSEAVADGDLEPTVSDHATDTLPPANTDDLRAVAGGRLGSKARSLNTGVSVTQPSFHINIPWPLVCLPFSVALAHRECSELS
ncbi:uncharacterized protein P884DRAFT_286591 [Thermothelomyces heterothallicus CBS 202.75]|uniref:uncharacterized protein n=1 Tax=Thermothelomyces heterothallicus CBS 202.75 TaxID=1149848 RepID=UPI00374313E3